MTEKENKNEPNQLEIESIRFFINCMLKAIYLGTCFILIFIPLIIIFG